ncbi:hypothetical protein G6F69_007594 [Rhizopus microsporus]|nr:hypothetical protein G6F69_007594 [Rhizopus microsporus]
MLFFFIQTHNKYDEDAMSLDDVSETDSKDVNDMVDIGNVDEEMNFETDWHRYESDNEPTYEESLVEDEQIIEPKEVKINYSTVDDLALQTSLKIFQYAKKSVSREVLSDIIGMVNNRMKAYCSEAPLLYSHYKSKERITKRFPAKIDEKCSNSKCEGNKIDAKKMMYLPLIDQLALFVNDKETFELLKSPRKNEKRSEVILIICLGLFADGFQVFKNGRHTMTTFHLIILNLPEVICTESKYMLQTCVAPDSTSPKDLFSFAKPIMKELMTLEHEEFKLAGSNMTINVHLLFAGGDIPVCAKLAGQSGHIHPSGCRCCTIKAVITEGRNVFYPSNSIAHRTKDSFKMTDLDSGQKLPTPFTSLKRFHGAFFFPIDLMHLFGCNVGPQIARLITTDDFSIDKRYQHPLRLINKDIQNINSLLRLSCTLVPTTFSGVMKNVESGYNRAVDWIHFLSSNVLIELASSRWIERVALFGNEDKIKAGEILLDDDEETEYEVWDPINRAKLRNNEEVLGFDCFPYLKLYLKVNTNKQRGSKIDIRKLAYFGEAILYLSVKCIKGEIWPYKTLSASYKVKLVNVNEIVSLCGRSINANEREYIFWPYQEKYDVSGKLKAQLENVHPSAEVDRPERTEQEKLAHDLFTGNLFSEPFTEHPLDENSKRKRQFSWDLYKKIMEDVYGSPVNKKTFNAAHDHLMLLKLPALIRQIKDEYKFEAGKPFNVIDPRRKLRAVELLEEMATPYIPFRTCSGSWGTSLLIRYY